MTNQKGLKKRTWEIIIKGTDKNGDFVVIKSKFKYPEKNSLMSSAEETFTILWNKVCESARREDNKCLKN